MDNAKDWRRTRQGLYNSNLILRLLKPHAQAWHMERRGRIREGMNKLPRGASSDTFRCAVCGIGFKQWDMIIECFPNHLLIAEKAPLDFGKEKIRGECRDTLNDYLCQEVKRGEINFDYVCDTCHYTNHRERGVLLAGYYPRWRREDGAPVRVHYPHPSF